jgi:outer membrane protein assembly factor BamB
MAAARPLATIAAALAVCVPPVFADNARRGIDWPSYRGPAATGVADGFPTAVSWNAEGRKNVAWSSAIPGLSHASPIVWRDRIYVVSAVSQSGNSKVRIGLYGDGDSADDNGIHEWKVYCLDKKSGKILWDTVACKGTPTTPRHNKATHANCTPATDGKRIVAFFGSEGLYCFDMDGKALWKKDFGALDSGPYDAPTLRWGFASSPIIFDGKVYVQCDVLNNGFLTCLDLKTGREIWRTQRDDVATWSTPAVFDIAGRRQMVVNGWKHIGGYNAATGKELWRMTGGGDIPVPTPILAHDLIYIANAHGKMSPLYAVRPNASGDITLKETESSNASIAWCNPRNGAYLQTPVVYGDLIYSCKSGGIVCCYDAKTGKQLYEERLGTGRTAFTSSPVAADGKVYFTSEEGDVYVLKAGPEFKLLATNPLAEYCLSTPAVSEGVLYFRTAGHLLAITDKAAPRSQ